MADVDDTGASHESPPETSIGSKSSAKRKRAGPSSRGVANLTPEQLARKRANDREAQRAIRERTKAQIDRLNQRIRELESAQPYHDLQVVLRQKEAIQAENEDIKRRLSSVLSIIQPILGTQGLHGTPNQRYIGLLCCLTVMQS
jgi:TolA-binding protein